MPTVEMPVSPPELRGFLCARGLPGCSSHAQTSQFLRYHLARAQSVAIALHNRRGGVEDRLVRALIRSGIPFCSQAPPQLPLNFSKALPIDARDLTTVPRH